MDSKAFEREVARLLTLAGFHVSPEKYVGSKKVDLFAETFEFGKRRRYAVECKAWDTALTLKQLNAAVADYRDLRDDRLIDVILLVTKSGISPAAQTKIDSSAFLIHLTILDLQRSVMDFSTYLEALVGEYEEVGFQNYYVPAQTLDTRTKVRMDLMGFVEEWLTNASAQPIALLAGYGAGKSTFAQHIAYRRAKEFQDTRLGRIPILIRLGEFCIEQSIDGLFGKLFAGRYIVRGYNFPLFQALNRAGSFLIILDGFDEMKQAMSAGIFRYTFKELLKLVKDNSKVILTGRPSAFLNNAERLEFLSALSTKGDRRFAIPERPSFREVTLAPFGQEQMTAFIRRYQHYLRKEKHFPDERIPREDEFFSTPELVELGSRPVHLQMLFAVLPSYRNSLSQLTARELYLFFLDSLVDREAEKPARQRFSSKRRREFLKALAFHMWNKNSPGLPIDEIPVAEFCTPGELAAYPDLDDVRRDLTSGAFIEIRFPEEIYFPHRSIQEYLLSEFVLEYFLGDPAAQEFVQKVEGTISLHWLDDHISPEVLDFMIASIGDKDRRELLGRLAGARRPLTAATLRLWTSSKAFCRDLVEEITRGNLWALALVVSGRLDAKWTFASSDVNEVYGSVVSLFSSNDTRDQDFIYQAFYLAWLLLSAEDDKSLRDSWMCNCITNLLRFRRKHGSSQAYRPSFIQRLVDHSRTEEMRKYLNIETWLPSLLRGEWQIGNKAWYGSSAGSQFQPAPGGLLTYKFRVSADLEEVLKTERGLLALTSKTAE